MHVVAFAGFIVEPNNTNIVDNEGQPIFEIVCGPENRLRHSPNHDLKKRPVLEHRAAADDQLSLHQPIRSQQPQLLSITPTLAIRPIGAPS
jgi:hypothetical protein